MTTPTAPTPTRPDDLETAGILHTVINTKHPKLALPTIASNHDLTLADLQNLLKRHGYPDNEQMRRHRQALLAGDDAPAADEQPSPLAATTVSLAAPYIAALPVSALFVDPAYQRDLDEQRVARMVRDYDPALVGIVEVSHRPDPNPGPNPSNDPGAGTYAILDGQHRWAAVRDYELDRPGAPDTPHVACRVHTGLTVDEEAKLYHRLNTTRKQLTGWDRWKARRSSGDETVAAIETTVTTAGWTVSYLGKRGQIKSTSGLEHVYRLGGRPLLAEVLDVITSSWRDDPEAVTNGILQGLGHILTHYDRDELDTHRLVDALTGIVPRQLNARAAAAREVHKGTLDKLTAHVIVELYNQVSRAGQIEPFLARVRPQTANKGTQRAADVEHARKVRAWAIEQGLIRPSSTHVPKDVYAAYDAAIGATG